MKSSKLAHFVVATLSMMVILFSGLAASENAAQLDRDVDNAIEKLYSNSATAKELSKTAKGILVFPDIIKAGLGIGGHYGKGALRVDGKTTGYYNTAAASFGLQAGAQSYGYAMFFMNDKALEYLNESNGWEVGVGPSVVVMDEGMSKPLSTTTKQDDVYVFTFDQSGLMAGLGIQGSKITKIDPDK
jgi:lipid-binding SYLF domain-containing protein